MKNGLIAIAKTDEKTEAVFIDQDVIECARLNMRTTKRINRRKKEQAAKARHKRNMRKAANRIIAEAGIGGAVALAGMAGMISPYLFIPVSIISVCAACMHFGAWIGKAALK